MTFSPTNPTFGVELNGFAFSVTALTTKLGEREKGGARGGYKNIFPI